MYSATKKNNSGRRANTQPKQAGGRRQNQGRGAKHDPIAGLTVVTRTFFLDGIMLEVRKGHFSWKPKVAHDAVGALGDFVPLSARAKVRISFRSDKEIYYTAGLYGKEKMAKGWSSGWIDLHEFQPPTMRCYGTDAPRGEYVVESAGVVMWEQEPRASLKGYREPAELVEDSDDEDEPELPSPARRSPTNGVKHTQS
jgi:hypothetical protein